VTTALITGAGGQDGILTARRLVAEGMRVIGVVRPGWSSPMAVYLDGVEIVEADLRDASSMDRIVELAGPDEVYHLGGSTSVAESFADPVTVADVNDRATEHLLIACRKHAPDARLALASSAEVFGPEVTGPRDERTPFDPRSPYAESKVAVHHHAATARAGGQHVSVGILFNHESPIRGRRFVTRKITRAAAEIACGRSETLRLGNLDVSRDWGAAADTVDALVRLVRSDDPGDFVVATGVLHTIGDLVEAAFEAAGVDDPWSFVVQDPKLMRARDTPGTVADNTLARERLGWQPSMTFADLVEAMVSADLTRVRTGVEEDPSYLR